MSKTLRRKGYSRDRKSLLEKFCFDSESFWTEQIDPKSPEGMKLIAVYHSDSGSFMGNAPHWYCNIYERRARRVAKHQLFKYMQNPENINANTGHQVLINSNHHRDATWAWW